MAKLSIECKKKMTEELASCLNNASTLIVTSYKGLSSQEMNELRRELRPASDGFLVIKDSIAKKAIAEGSNNRVADLIKGEVGIVIKEDEDASLPSKVLIKFSKNHESLKIHGGIMTGELASRENIVRLAALPSREILLGSLANVLNAPIQGLAGALSAILCKLAYALNAVKDKKGGAENVRREED